MFKEGIIDVDYEIEKEDKAFSDLVKKGEKE